LDVCGYTISNRDDKDAMNIIQKDITTVERGVLINGVNCQRAMGSGVALAYMTKWPEVRSQYMRFDKIAMWLGKFEPVLVDKDLYVANCWTQEYAGSDGRRYADIGAIMASVGQAMLFARARGLPVYTPWVGAGLGGLSQMEVQGALQIMENLFEIPLTVCEI
jgi:O-acetyl-ADP-ribose deacetylase (regulator of RNase III)